MTADTASNNNNTNNNANNNNNNANKNYNKQTTTESSSNTTSATRLNTTASHAFNNSTNSDSAVALTTTIVTPAPPASPTTTIELSENFYISNKRKNNVKIQVKLNASGIFLRRETKENDQVLEQHIRLEDIIGSRCGTRLKKRARGGLVSCKSLQDDDQQQQQQPPEHPTQKSQATTQLGQHIRREELDKKTLKSSSSSGTHHNTKHSSDASDNSAYLYIYAYVKRDKPLRRVQTIRILRFRTHDSYPENLLVAERWHHGIRMLKSQGRQMETNHLLVLLNPKSGSGKGRELFQKQVAPVLKEANVQYDLQVTTHSNYAREFIRSRRDLLQRYSGIVVASGDGLFYEVLNGLMERDDWRLLSRKMPIGIIPCGSGNGLAKSIAHCYNEPYEPKPILTATLACVSGNTTPMDIVRIEVARSGKHAVMWSFLSVGWGLIADIDIESEKLRSIGAPRFTLWSIHRLISLRTYKGKLSYLPWVGPPKLERTESQPQTPFASARETERERQGEFFDLPDIDEEFQDFEGPQNDDDDFVDARSLDGTSYRTHVDSWHSAMSRRTAYYSLAGQSTRSSQSVTASMYSKIEAANAELEQRAPVTNIPPLNMPLDGDPEWKHEDGEFVMVHAAYTTHLASDCHFAPNSKLNDGIIYLVVIRGGVGRSQLLQFLLNLSSGTHLPEQPNEFITVLPVRAFRIVPSGNDGIMTVDGERVEYGAIQGEMFPSMINVMVPYASEAEEQQAMGSSDEEDNDNDSEEQQKQD